MEELAQIIYDALNDVGNYDVKAFRNYEGNTKSAGFEIYEDGLLITTFDIGMKDNKEYTNYVYEDIKFKGSNIDKIMADKINSCSTRYVFRRCKDLVDLYALSFCVSFDFNKINDIVKNSNKNIGDFNEFLNRKDELEHAYNKLSNIENKPDFEELYDRLLKLFQPFIEKTKTTSLNWNNINFEWEHLTLEKKIDRIKSNEIQIKKVNDFEKSIVKMIENEYQSTNKFENFIIEQYKNKSKDKNLEFNKKKLNNKER